MFYYNVTAFIMVFFILLSDSLGILDECGKTITVRPKVQLMFDLHCVVQWRKYVSQIHTGFSLRW